MPSCSHDIAKARSRADNRNHQPEGGAGKTTLALHIAVAAELAGYSIVVLDMDPPGDGRGLVGVAQRSAARSGSRENSTLAKTLEKAAGLGAETAKVVTEIGQQVAPVRLSERAAFRHATGSDKTAQEIEAKGKAAEEVAAFWVWVCQQVGVPPRKRVTTRTKVMA